MTSTPDSQTGYWNSAGLTKSFTHPIDVGWLRGLAATARIVDYGCGYGRVAGLVRQHGFAGVEGFDVSAGLVERARRAHPDLRFTTLTRPPRLPVPDGDADAVLLMAVLTCVPSDAGQRELIGELRRVLRPGGLLYVSDVLLQTDERNVTRYRRSAHAAYGVFETDDGAICRHHDRTYLGRLLDGFDLCQEREIEVATMNGNPVRAIQILAAKR
jgi:SAM-dependent methyltransferase